MDVKLRSERLVLRPVTEDDIPAILAGLNDFEVTQYLTRVPHPFSVADAREWLAMLAAPTPDAAHLAITLADEGDGMVGVVALENELGYWLDRRYHGRGLMTEASITLLDWHFAARPDSLVPSGVHVGNTASLNVQRKLGFVEWPGTELRFARSLGREVPHIKTTLGRTDYEAAKSQLRSRSWT
jgi:RimJ/RimL family protein N-acetyltransferase